MSLPRSADIYYMTGETGNHTLEHFLAQTRAAKHMSAVIVIDDGGGDLDVLRTLMHMILTRYRPENIYTLVLTNAISCGFMMSQIAPVGNRYCLRHSILMSHKAQVYYEDPKSKKSNSDTEKCVKISLEWQEAFYKLYVKGGVNLLTKDYTCFTAYSAWEEGLVDHIVDYDVFLQIHES